jgi:Putative MetA-pathway of phenol degradation
MTRRFHLATGVVWISFLATSAVAQDLDPRAYAKVPTGLTLVIAGISFSEGGVLTDPTLPVENVHADTLTPSVGIARSFSLFGRTAQGLAALPYSWAQATGEVGESTQRIERSGLSDMRLRLSVLIAGAPAMTPKELAKSPRRPIVGTSLTVVAPTGQYSPQRFINLGTNRWAFKPEVALSYPVRDKWLVDVYAALWLFRDNGSFYPGSAVRAQAPMGALQAHVSYSFSPKAWTAFDATWYAGGQASVDHVPTGGSESNSRVGATLNFPVGSRHAIKVAWSTGAVIRSGADFTTFSLGWQAGWLDRPRAQKP